MVGNQYSKFKVAAVQAMPVFLDREATVKKACALIENAGRNGADLVVFPETWIPTYPFWLELSAVKGSVQDFLSLQRKAFIRLFKNSVEIPSSSTDVLCKAAKKAGTYVVIGMNEKDSDYSRGTLYNTLLYIDKKGRIMGRHRKLIPTSWERTVWGRGDGSDLLVIKTDLGRLSGLICWENHMPLARYALYSQGEQIHVAAWPTGSGGEFLCRQIAFEGGCFVIAVGAYLDEDLIPADFALEQRLVHDRAKRTGTAIISPKGDYVAGPMNWEEGVLYGEIDLELVASQKYMLDVAGHYSRPDIFRLLINQKRLLPLSLQETGNHYDSEPYDSIGSIIDDLIRQIGRISDEEIKKRLEDLKRVHGFRRSASTR